MYIKKQLVRQKKKKEKEKHREITKIQFCK